MILRYIREKAVFYWYIDTECVKKSTQIGPKNGPKMDPKLGQNCAQNNTLFAQNNTLFLPQFWYFFNTLFHDMSKNTGGNMAYTSRSWYVCKHPVSKKCHFRVFVYTPKCKMLKLGNAFLAQSALFWEHVLSTFDPLFGRFLAKTRRRFWSKPE